MRVLVTGAAGFIGSNLSDYLLTQGEDVVALDNFHPLYARNIKEKNLEQAFKNPNFQLVEGDITDGDSMEKLFSQGCFDTVVHLAAQVGSRQSLGNPLPYYQVNIEGTQVLFNCCQQTNISHLVMASTSTVYQDQPSGLLYEESSVTAPLTPYAISKLANEFMAKILVKESGIPVTVLRIFSTYGPRQRPDLAIHSFFNQIYRREPIETFACEGSVRDYIYVKDCIRAIYEAMQNPNGFCTFNVGSGQGTSLSSLINIISEVTGIEIVTKKTPPLHCELKGGVAAIAKAKNMLSFNPHYDLKKGLTEFYHWFHSVNEEIGANNV